MQFLPLIILFCLLLIYNRYVCLCVCVCVCVCMCVCVCVCVCVVMSSLMPLLITHSKAVIWKAWSQMSGGWTQVTAGVFYIIRIKVFDISPLYIIVIIGPQVNYLQRVNHHHLPHGNILMFLLSAFLSRSS